MSSALPGPAKADSNQALLPVEAELLAVGKLLHPHGVHGEILMEVYTDFPERIVAGIDLYLGIEEALLHITHRRPHKGGLLLTFEGYTSPESVGQLRNRLLYVRADNLPSLAKGEYYQHQLLNLHVTSDTGQPIGVVNEIIETGASDVLVVRPQTGPDVLIPIVDSFVQDIDLSAGEITVHIIPGMIVEEV